MTGFTPFASFELGTLLVQWGIARVAFLLLDRWQAGGTLAEPRRPSSHVEETV